LKAQTVSVLIQIFVMFNCLWCCANIRNFESNRIVTSVFDSKRAQLFHIFEYLLSPISYLFNRMTPIFHLSNHA